MSNVKKSIFIAVPVDKFGAYAKNPKDWPQWYVHLSGPDELEGDGGAGTQAEFKYSMLGIHLPVTIKVVECNTSPEKHYWRGIVEGGIAATQTMTAIAKDGGSEATLEIEYTIPGNILGKIADALILEKIQENATMATLENLKAICEAL